MKHLKKITISNARRFGKDVEIELSSGANIFLAPNGTGKTTLFEAIEFALTGSIQRLVNPPLSLIRDKQNDVDVRLDFDNGNYCEVNYRKGSEPKISGDHDLLFPEHSIKDVPFLLRLTHLIEQRGNNWFIQKGESSQAGDLLDKLSIGKDLSTIAKTKSNTLNAATRTINEKKDEKNKHEEKVSILENKLKERDNAKLNYVLKPLNEIIDQIQRIHKQFDGSSNLENIDQKPDAVVSYRGLVNSVLIKLEEDNQKRLFNLSNLESKISLFESNNTEIVDKKKQIAEKTDIAQKADLDLAPLKTALPLLQDAFNKETDIQKDLQKSKGLLDKKKEEEAKSISTEKSIKAISESISEQKEKLKTESELVDKLNAKIAAFNSIRGREAEALKKQGEFNSLRLVIEDWNTHLLNVAEIKNLINIQTGQKAGSQKKIEDFQTDLLKIEKLFNESQTKLNSLKNASDAILGAVGIIATNLPDDQRNCPVCNAEYEPDELSKQIALALEQIDPIISSEIETNNTLKTEVDIKKQQIQNEKTTLSKINENLVENEDKSKNLQEFINEKCLPRFADSNNINEANEWLINEKEKNNVNLEKIFKDKTEFGEEPSSEELSKLITARDQTRDTIHSNELNVTTLTASLENIKTEIEKINQSLSLINIDLLDSQISTIATEIEATTSKITDNTRASEQIVKVKREAEEQITDLNMAISKLQGQQNEILAEWKDSNLIEPPSMDNLNVGKTKLIKQSDLIRKGLEDLNKISDELGRWNAAEKFATLDKEIKEICVNQDEQLYLSNMKKRLSTIDGELSFITERKTALEILYRKIGEEVNGVHDKIKAINPLWVSLLKKIVVNPRFVETQLESYSYRNKSQAEVKINLHDEQVSVMEVASEAQATDLQLTFMLSMASTYKWTPWKSLLLDDPTQHHDLVHASGVFDLLRDYITDQGFQVLMGTHDVIQAKFFQRKLENENIDVKLWRLIANDDGVRAELIN
ncbi:exonuclease SbcC [Pedobacter psychrotolerans]|uniref:Chromosome segregation protein SMC n=1 Tax=Pedobacter psychrotolerans TaxID=1843235 RepID=A0A4V6NMY4_9SPHI|nr:AAA family ATPase [Pedobacter psychrotolerans]TCO19937.1 exonuclease SbcC [Pedobacter psychrotolerans]GGE49967.1 chromosome segregation protein SMC [Pedobacter psychrotolerans]